MKRRTRNLLLVTLVLCLAGISVAGWATIRVVAWMRGLPDRIVIDSGDWSEAIGAAFVQSYHDGLTSGNVQQQREILQSFISAAADDVNARQWIRSEFESDLQQLSQSPQAEVATLANNLLDEFRKQQ